MIKRYDLCLFILLFKNGIILYASGDIMVNLINKYRKLSFEEKTIFGAKFSVFSNAIFGVGKIILAIPFGIFFLVAGILNIFIMMSKLECYLGEKYPEKKSFIYRNRMIGLFLLLAGLQYAIYMGRLIFTDTEIMDYGMFLGITIACVSFVEMGIAIKGWFNSTGKGHYYRNVKLINFCQAMTAIVLTEIAIMSFAYEGDSRVLDGLFGMSVGAFIVLIAIYVFFAPKISIVDREHNVYLAENNDYVINDEHIEIQLTNSKFYGNYTYVGIREDNMIDGHIIKGKSHIWKWNIYVKILIIVLSEILIFPYVIGGLIFHFKNVTLIKKLDKQMLSLGYKKIINKELI